MQKSKKLSFSPLQHQLSNIWARRSCCVATIRALTDCTHSLRSSGHYAFTDAGSVHIERSDLHHDVVLKIYFILF